MPRATRQPGTSATPARLLAAARELFAERGYAATSVRDVAEAAGAANTGAVNYHFGGKEQLFVAVIRSVTAPLEAERLAALAAVQASGTPTVEAILDAWVRPLVRLAGSTEGRLVAKLFSRLAQDATGDVSALVLDVFAETDRTFLAALRDAAPDVPEPVLRWRYGALLGILVFFQLGVLDGLAGGERDEDEDAVVRHLSCVMAAAVRAPMD